MRDGRGWALTAMTTAAVTGLVSLGGVRLAAQGGTAGRSSVAPAQVRSSDRLIAELIAKAERRSTTFRELLAELASTNGIVYVESGQCGHGARACLLIWMRATGGKRYLRILVDRKRADSDVDLTGSIGHELQHTIEALSDVSVVDGTTMYSFFKRYAPTDNSRFETTAAIDAGNAIRDELRQQPPLTRTP
jgi:hypothetical protein